METERNEEKRNTIFFFSESCSSLSCLLGFIPIQPHCSGAQYEHLCLGRIRYMSNRLQNGNIVPCVSKPELEKKNHFVLCHGPPVDLYSMS